MESAARLAATAERSGPPSVLDGDSQAWLRDLRTRGAAREAALERLHALLVRAARFEVARRRSGLPHLRGNELEDIALEVADHALVSVLARLDDSAARAASRPGSTSSPCSRPP